MNCEERLWKYFMFKEIVSPGHIYLLLPYCHYDMLLLTMTSL